MAGRAAKLSAPKVRTAKPGSHMDGDGLRLVVRANGSRFWLLRYQIAGKSREMGLGRAGDDRAAVPLSATRDEAARLRTMVKSGVDPLASRDVEQAATVAAAQRAAIQGITFQSVAEAYLKAHAMTWRNSKHRAQWTSTLETYVYPHMDGLPVTEVGTEHVLAVLEPIWRVKAETAGRIRGRVETVLDYATARHWRTGDNPARWRGHLSSLLPAKGKVAPVEHHAALPWSDVAGFLTALCRPAGTSPKALAFAILTAARSGEVLGARWS